MKLVRYNCKLTRQVSFRVPLTMGTKPLILLSFVAIAFMARAVSNPSVTAVVNGASFQPGIEAGSWVAIVGTNLSDTTNQWTAADFNGQTAPTSLSGVSVTIDGIPAYICFVSPTQINVVAPADSNTGAVPVVVNNKGHASAPATAQLQSFAPGLFMASPGNFALVSRLPDNSTVADPSVVSGAVAAGPGDYVVAWATGFGVTGPAFQAGVTVSGAPPVATSPPSISVGGIPAAALLTSLSPGSIGVYSLVFQVPLNAPSGTVPLQISVGGYQAQAAMIFIAGQ